MRIFVTGASGFVGGAIVQNLKGKHEILALSRSERSDASIRQSGAQPLRGELGAVRAQDLSGVQCVIHCAAYVKPFGRRADFQAATIEGTRQLLDAARQAGVRRFIQISTEAALFAGQDMLSIDEDYPYPEKHRYLYPWSKAEAEKLVRAANADGTFETITLRPRLVWGPGDQTVLPALVEMVQRDAFAWIDGGKAQTSTTHIANFVHAVELALERGRAGAVYFITDDEVFTFREFLGRLIATRGLNAPDKSMPGWLARGAAFLVEGGYRLLGLSSEPPLTRFAAAIMSANCTIRIDRARKELGYNPQISVSDGLAQLQAASRPML